jgi:hypothetical protein
MKIRLASSRASFGANGSRRGPAWWQTVTRVAEVGATLIVGIALLGVVLLSRAQLPSNPLAIGASTPESPTAAMASAASLLDQSVAKGGAGYSFEILQRSTIQIRPGGPKIEIPDPIDRHKSLGFADAYEVGALIERGAVTPAGFTMEMRTGPAPGELADWKAPYQFGVISTAGKTFRDDGVGWYPTDSPPGVGLDPLTASLLPTVIRNVSAVANDGFTKVGAVLLPKITGTAKVADIPGVIAADGKRFTELVAPLEFALDEQGRVAQVHVVARNTNLDVYDLIVDTTITFAYPGQAAPLPEPVPVRPASADIVQK